VRFYIKTKGFFSDEINVNFFLIRKRSNQNQNWLEYEGSIAYTETPLGPLL
jgi:hypothetical protein